MFFAKVIKKRNLFSEKVRFLNVFEVLEARTPIYGGQPFVLCPEVTLERSPPENREGHFWEGHVCVDFRTIFTKMVLLVSFGDL